MLEDNISSPPSQAIPCILKCQENDTLYVGILLLSSRFVWETYKIIYWKPYGSTFKSGIWPRNVLWWIRKEWAHHVLK